MPDTLWTGTASLLNAEQKGMQVQDWIQRGGDGVIVLTLIIDL